MSARAELPLARGGVAVGAPPRPLETKTPPYAAFQPSARTIAAASSAIPGVAHAARP